MRSQCFELRTKLSMNMISTDGDVFKYAILLATKPSA